jgi:hypothetical protein
MVSKESTDEDPICVLKVELDGQHTEKIIVYKNDNPIRTVEVFG